MDKQPETMNWHGMTLVRISDVGDDFLNWMRGQTLPYVVEDEKSPMDWAYVWDYNRYKSGLKVED